MAKGAVRTKTPLSNPCLWTQVVYDILESLLRGVFGPYELKAHRPWRSLIISCSIFLHKSFDTEAKDAFKPEPTSPR